jgi:hypothetical protein
MVSNDMYSLDNLRDIAIPAAPPFWPPAPAVLVILAVATVALLIAGWQLILGWRRNAYRRAGLVLLREVRTGHEVSVVLKRVALAVFPREQVAALYGATWLAFLNRTCASGHFSDGAMLQTETQAQPELFTSAETWIRTHRLPEDLQAKGRN